jgi:hypothetical protein
MLELPKYHVLQRRWAAAKGTMRDASELMIDGKTVGELVDLHNTRTNLKRLRDYIGREVVVTTWRPVDQIECERFDTLRYLLWLVPLGENANDWDKSMVEAKVERLFNGVMLCRYYTSRDSNPYMELVVATRAVEEDTKRKACTLCTAATELCVQFQHLGAIGFAAMVAAETETLFYNMAKSPCTCGLDNANRVLGITSRLSDAIVQSS